MKIRYLYTGRHGFYGAYYQNPVPCKKAVILMLGDRIDDIMVKAGVRWLFRRGCNVLAMAPQSNDYAFHSYKIEYFERAVRYLKWKGNTKFGICGASTTGMAALAAASYVKDLTLTIALSPCDYIMEGFYRDGLDGARERPGFNESSLSYRGKDLPYLPFAYRHPEYWQKIQEETKLSGEMIATREMFDLSEERCPITEQMRIKTEKIRGTVICVGAEDDSLWDTCRYIRRMEKSLEEHPHKCSFTALLYEHGSHLVFPQSMLDLMIPLVSGQLLKLTFRPFKEYPRECKETRIDIDRKLTAALRRW